MGAMWVNSLCDFGCIEPVSITSNLVLQNLVSKLTEHPTQVDAATIHVRQILRGSVLSTHRLGESIYPTVAILLSQFLIQF